jgi:hypothetical protein
MIFSFVAVAPQDHDATDSALGYYYQGMFALLVLLDSDDGGGVSLETDDDITASGSAPRLLQLKHSTGTPAALTTKSDGFWKTLPIWIPHLSRRDLRFVFVSCAQVADSSSMAALTEGTDRAALCDELRIEAERVLAAIAAARAEKKELPYAKRRAGCEAFLALTPPQRAELLSRITVIPGAPSIIRIESEVERRLTLQTRAMRPQIARRLIEWWDYRVVQSLTATLPRVIEKEEVLARITDIVVALADDSLPDDFGWKLPPDLTSDLGSNMEHQIRLVDGGDSRVRRAAEARWRAREQRNRWMSERAGLAQQLQQYDEALIRFWRDRHDPLCDDCKTSSDQDKRSKGRELLDWSHLAAHLEIPRLRPKWDKPFLVQGSYQQLAEQLHVGWHPDYHRLVSRPVGNGSDEKGGE